METKEQTIANQVESFDNSTSVQQVLPINFGELLTEKNIARLKNLFKTPHDYAKHMGALCVFREMVSKAVNEDKDNKLFPLYDTINGLIGCLLNDDLNVDNIGRVYYYKDSKKIYL